MMKEVKHGTIPCKRCNGKADYYWDMSGSVYSSCQTCESMIFRPEVTKTVTPEELYNMGYKDGKSGKAANASHVHDENYEMGYADGKGDRASRPVAVNYSEENEPPPGFVFTDEKRVPEPGEWYLSKNGNAIQAKKVRGNNQTRHILIPD